MVQRLTSHGAPEAHQSTAASIRTQILQPLQSVPQLLADAPARPPAALGSTETDIRASDLQLQAQDGSMSGATGNSSSQQQQQQQQQGAGNGATAAESHKRRYDATLAWQAAAAAVGPGLMGSPDNLGQPGDPSVVCTPRVAAVPFMQQYISDASATHLLSIEATHRLAHRQHERTHCDGNVVPNAFCQPGFTLLTRVPRPTNIAPMYHMNQQVCHSQLILCVVESHNNNNTQLDIFKSGPYVKGTHP